MTAETIQNADVEAERTVAQAFLRRLSGSYDVAQAILFGSRARGDHRVNSDLNLAVVLKGQRGDFIDIKLDRSSTVPWECRECGGYAALAVGASNVGATSNRRHNPLPKVPL